MSTAFLEIQPPINRRVDYNFQHIPYCQREEFKDITKKESSYFSKKSSQKIANRISPRGSYDSFVTPSLIKSDNFFPRWQVRGICGKVSESWSVCNCFTCLKQANEKKEPWGIVWEPRNEPPLPVVWMANSHLLHSLALLSRKKTEFSSFRNLKDWRESQWILRTHILISEAERREMLPTEEHLFLAAERATSEGFEVSGMDLVALWAIWDPRWTIGGGRIDA